jgi:hypothetical protein
VLLASRQAPVPDDPSASCCPAQSRPLAIVGVELEAVSARVLPTRSSESELTRAIAETLSLRLRQGDGQWIRRPHEVVRHGEDRSKLARAPRPLSGDERGTFACGWGTRRWLGGGLRLQWLVWPHQAQQVAVSAPPSVLTPQQPAELGAAPQQDELGLDASALVPQHELPVSPLASPQQDDARTGGRLCRSGTPPGKPPVVSVIGWSTASSSAIGSVVVVTSRTGERSDDIRWSVAHLSIYVNI